MQNEIRWESKFLLILLLVKRTLLSIEISQVLKQDGTSQMFSSFVITRTESRTLFQGYTLNLKYSAFITEVVIRRSSLSSNVRYYRDTKTKHA